MKPQFPSTIFVTGIGTNVGKTVAAAVLTEALRADYWKPVQTGAPDDSDSRTIKSLLSNGVSRIHPEAYALRIPASPHYAAAEEGVVIELQKMGAPVTSNRLVIEGAGGLLVPLNSKQLIVDYVVALAVPVVVVVRNYLGAINHTLLTLECLKQREIPVAGLLFNGTPYLDNEAVIAQFGEVRVLGHIEEAVALTPAFISEQALLLRQSLETHYTL